MNYTQRESWAKAVFIALIILCLNPFSSVGSIATSNMNCTTSTNTTNIPKLTPNKTISTSIYADLELIVFEVWWAELNNGTIYIRYLVENKGDIYHNPKIPVRLNITFTRETDEKPFAYINQKSFIDPHTWYPKETIGGCIQVPLSKKPSTVEAHVNPFLDIPESNMQNNNKTVTVYNGIIIKGKISKLLNQELLPASHVNLKKCNNSSLQSSLYIRFNTNTSGYYCASLFPKKPIDKTHTYDMIITDEETSNRIHLTTPPIYYNDTIYQNITFKGKPPNTPLKPFGFIFGFKNKTYPFLAKTKDPDSDMLWYKFKWDVNSFSNWIGPVSSWRLIFLTHSWHKSGTYSIKVLAKDMNGMLSQWSKTKKISIIDLKYLPFY